MLRFSPTYQAIEAKLEVNRVRKPAKKVAYKTPRPATKRAPAKKMPAKKSVVSHVKRIPTKKAPRR
jgi:hypothetical protein